MADDYVGATDAPEGAGVKLLRMFRHLVGAKNVQSEGVVVVDPTDAAAAQTVKNSAPGATDYGAVVRVPEPAAATLSTVNQNAASTQFLAANAARRAITIVNEIAAGEQGEVLFVALAGAATVVAYTYPIPPGGVWERRGGYTGVIFGIWGGAGGGRARITEEA